MGSQTNQKARAKPPNDPVSGSAWLSCHDGYDTDPLDMAWQPTSWQSRPLTQQPVYPDPAALEDTLGKLALLPPLVTSWEIEALKTQLAEAEAGRCFLLQGGDCAERFDECDSPSIAAKLKILLQMSLVLVHGTCKRVIRVGRFAGQYAKPRTIDSETRDGITLPSYRGDLVNGIGFTEQQRTPDPIRLLRAYERAALTLNFIRGLVDGGFADLHHPENWDLDWVEHSPQGSEYKHMVEQIGESLRFMETLSGSTAGEINRVDFFTSHEALHLLFEQAQTRQVPRREGWYNLSTHFPWVGMRTSQLDGAHIDYISGIQNPIAIKVGPELEPEHLLKLVEKLDPDNTPGRLTVIHRLGTHNIARLLPAMITTVTEAGRSVLWCCDPMHGNTETTRQGIKTRKFEHITTELQQAFDIHENIGTNLGGVHFELTGENVTECTGGARGLSDEDLKRTYKSQVDPRLNYEQALEMAMLIARRLSNRKPD
jgi:3-deoxy-7-phosphoheptulonate synthase